MKPVIAIVGRPNVGKSTLFNRLTRSRDALVADWPGVTRDFLVGEGRHGPIPHLLMDTGGLLGQGAATAGLEQQIFKHTLEAVEDAHCLLWLVDSRAGCTGGDETLGQLLRRRGQRCYLLANKAESPNFSTPSALAEFYRLGMGTPHPVSALQGNGVTELMTEVLSLPELQSPASVQEPKPDARVAIIGRPNVGKSTLVNRLLGQARMITSEQPGTTRDSVAAPLERPGHLHLLIDTAGIRRRSRPHADWERLSVVKTLQAVEQAQLALVVLDAGDGFTDQDARIIGLTLQRGRRLAVAANKWDLLTSQQRSQARQQFADRMAFAPHVRAYPTSALHGSGIGGLYTAIEQALVSLNQDFSASQLTRMLHLAIEQNPPPRVRGRRSRLLYAHMGGREPLRIVVHGRRLEQVPDHYRRYLANCLRTGLKLKGTPVWIEFRQSLNPYAKTKPRR